MKSYSKFAKIALAILLLIAILFGLNYFSKKIFPEKKVTMLVEMSLPAETQNLNMGVEDGKLLKGNGKDSVLITGWVLKQKGQEKKKEVYMVLKSDKDTLVFKIGNSNLIRPDVKKYFQLGEGIDNHGFEMSFPLSLLKEKYYQIGFILEDKSGKYFAMSSKAVAISDSAVKLADFKLQSDSIVKSKQVSLTFKVPTGKINCNIETIKISDINLNISGWAFLQGMNSDSMKTYILLKKNEKVAIFSMGIQIRNDVTKYFMKSKLNLDASGFSAQIPTGNLENGHYQVGLYIEKGKNTGLIYVDKFMDIGK
jgi:hypothetical protein